MFRKVYNSSSGKIADGRKFSVYIYRHPLESGQERWHVHFVRKSDGISMYFDHSGPQWVKGATNEKAKKSTKESSLQSRRAPR